jgi:tight adherence protein C
LQPAYPDIGAHCLPESNFKNRFIAGNPVGADMKKNTANFIKCAVSLIEMKVFQLCEKLLRCLPDDLFGKSTDLRELYEKRYWRKDSAELVKKTRLHTAFKYLCVAAVLLLFGIGTLLSGLQSDPGLTRIERPDYGSSPHTERLTVRMQYDKEILVQKMAVRIAPRKLTAGQTAAKLDSFADTLQDRILGENKDLDHVTTDLVLLSEDAKSGIRIEWLSDAPALLSDDGRIDSVAVKEAAMKKSGSSGNRGRIVKLTAVYELNGQDRQTALLVHLLPGNSSDRETLENRLRKTAEDIEKKVSAQKILTLPEILPGNIRLTWSRERSVSLPEILLAGLVSFLLIYLFRYRRAKADWNADRETILRDLPEFVNKLVLLLSAGLVTEAAVRKITFDYQKHADARRRPLYEGFCEIEKRMRETNAPFLKELKLFAQKSDVREFIRFSTIMEENIHTGNTLNEKLEGEAAMLWFYRKKKAEERGRLAETKLTFPLAIQLLVLMLITLAPVFLKI